MDLLRLEIRESEFSNNSTSGNGGGIFASGIITIERTLISNNRAQDEGGGIYQAGASIVLNESTLADNYAGNEGGGIQIAGSSTRFEVTNSTISTNRTDGDGGGIHIVQSFATPAPELVSIRNSTIVSNSAGSSGGGLDLGLGKLISIFDSIIAGNNAQSDNPDCNADGTITTNGFNLFGENNSDCDPSGTNNTLENENATISDVLLGLADNGGSTPTHALRAGSPAIDGDSPDCLLTDQRGVVRDDFCDIGAYEYPPSGIIGNLVWYDDDANGIPDSDEDGIAGVTITLLNTITSVISTTVTNNIGEYTFSSLAASTYTVQLDTSILPPDVIQTFDRDGNLDNETTFFIGSDGTVENADFGYLRPSSISGTVWCDANENDTPDVGEGLSSITVTLDPTQRSAATDSNGNYTFDDLPKGTYTITVNSSDLPTICITQTIDPDATPDNQTVLSLDADSDITNQNFGYIELASIGDYIWQDENANGLQDSGESGLGGIDINLWSDDDRNGTPDRQLNSTQSSQPTGAGFYSFGQLDPRLTYFVEVINPANRQFTLQDAGNDDTFDSDVDPNTGLIGPIDLVPGESNNDIDAGMLPPYAITLTPSTDVNVVGFPHTVTAIVTDEQGTPVSSQTVRFSVPNGNSPTTAQDLTNSSGEATFVFTRTINVATIDTVTAWLDYNNNGTRESFEPLAEATKSWNSIALTVRGSGVGTDEQAVRTIVVSVTESIGGTPVSGLSVGFAVTGTNVVPTQTQDTIGGETTFVYTSNASVATVAAGENSSAAAAQMSNQVQEVQAAQNTDLITIWVDLNRNRQNNIGEPDYFTEEPAAVNLISFTVQYQGMTAILKWKTADETDNAGFNLYRATDPAGPFNIPINEKLISARGSEFFGATYTYIDTPTGNGPFYYMLEDVDLNGKAKQHGPISTDGLSLDRPEMRLRIFLPILNR